jgi:hypothetical protein
MDYNVKIGRMKVDYKDGNWMELFPDRTVSRSSPVAGFVVSGFEPSNL